MTLGPETCSHDDGWFPGGSRDVGLFVWFFVLNMIILKTMRCSVSESSLPCRGWRELNLQGSARIDMAARQSLELPKLFKLGTPLVEYRWISNVSANYKTKPQNHTDSHCWFDHVKYMRNGGFLKWGSPQIIQIRAFQYWNPWWLGDPPFEIPQ